MGYFSRKHGQQEGGWLLCQPEEERGGWMAAGQSSSFVGFEKENIALACYYSVPPGLINELCLCVVFNESLVTESRQQPTWH